MRTIHILGILILLALAVPATPAYAGGVVSVCDEAHLRAALAGGGTVTFTCNDAITLAGELVIAADTTIDGSGQTVTISGNHAVRVFTVNEGVTLNLNKMTVANGSTDIGGGLYNQGTLNVSNSIFGGNSADAGGGIYNDYGGTLIVSTSIFGGNTAGGGGGILNYGTMTVSNSTLSGNRAGGGGGISNNGTLAVSNSILSGNIADGGIGGGIGGGIFNYGNVTVSNSAFSGNSSWYGGGGIYNGGTLIVRNSTFSGNSIGYGGDGGGISNYGDTVTVSNSTFFGNSADAGGGIYNGGTLIVSNGTFSGNRAPGYGGGINNGGTVTLKNTIVANSPAGPNCIGAITDGGGNLSYPDTTCPGINRDPLLDPLQNNGGSTQTMALRPGSAALDAAIDAICAAPPVNNLDQRGAARPQGPHCDIGAVEQEPYRKTWLPTIRSQ